MTSRIAYTNWNIHPAEEYEHRRAVLLDFARRAAPRGNGGRLRPAGVVARCRRVRQRFRPAPRPLPRVLPPSPEEACAYAAANGFEGVATTPHGEPHQYTETICEEPICACEPPWPGGGVPRLSRAMPRGHATQQGHGHVSPEPPGAVRFPQDRSRGKNARLAKPSAPLRRLPRKPPKPRA